MPRSANLEIMIRAATRAARILARDFGEVEQLQVSIKGPGDFVSAADRRAEQGRRSAGNAQPKQRQEARVVVKQAVRITADVTTTVGHDEDVAMLEREQPTRCLDGIGLAHHPARCRAFGQQPWRYASGDWPA